MTRLPIHRVPLQHRFPEESQVRTRLPAGGRWIRTIGPAVKARVTRVFTAGPAAPRCQRQQGSGARDTCVGTRESVESVAAFFYVKAVRRLMAPAGIEGGDEAVRNGAAQDDLFAVLLYQHPLAC